MKLRFVRYGGLSSVRQRGYDPSMPGFHSPPARRGIYAFVALETSRQVAIIDVHRGHQIARINVGRAPQGLVLTPSGTRLFVNNFMDRTVGVYNVSNLLTRGIADVPLVTTRTSYFVEKMTPEAVLGKQLFYDAQDTRLARDGYISCASCHNDGGGDGRTWDLTGFGEGLRNTVSLRGRAGAHGFLHWSNNFDEVQDFEGQIRALAGGTGLMSDADFYAGIRSSGGAFHLKQVDTTDPSMRFVKDGGHFDLYLGVDDVDAFAEQLREAGVYLIQPPGDTDWGTRELVFEDDQGHTIYAGMRA